jgi:hypothetical protein
MSGQKARLDKLYAGTISDITSKIVVKKGETILKQAKSGNNPQKVIEIVIRL